MSIFDSDYRGQKYFLGAQLQQYQGAKRNESAGRSGWYNDVIKIFTNLVRRRIWSVGACFRF
jgi:hypothetical protein